MMRFVLLLSIIGSIAGCTVNPWVQPYERGNLADPVMKFERHPLSAAFMTHVYEAREAARGADGSGGGGCGCN